MDMKLNLQVPIKINGCNCDLECKFLQFAKNNEYECRLFGDLDFDEDDLPIRNIECVKNEVENGDLS